MIIIGGRQEKLQLLELPDLFPAQNFRWGVLSLLIHVFYSCWILSLLIHAFVCCCILFLDHPWFFCGLLEPFIWSYFVFMGWWIFLIDDPWFCPLLDHLIDHTWFCALLDSFIQSSLFIFWVLDDFDWSFLAFVDCWILWLIILNFLWTIWSFDWLSFFFVNSSYFLNFL